MLIYFKKKKHIFKKHHARESHIITSNVKLKQDLLEKKQIFSEKVIEEFSALNERRMCSAY